ncbi:MAG TPA: hypothetical protein VL625_10485 [Patescibacteria group bacterium]|nr:hypothetical protein [Patescibacteria group bacterium]
MPSYSGAKAFGLGDGQMAYRLIGIMLQNLGSTGAYNEPLMAYDYDKIGAWLRLGDRLDPDSNFLPALAAFYFGSIKSPQQLGIIVDYLSDVGSRDDGTGVKWRWLAQGVYLARWGERDLPKALRLANELSTKWRPGRPLWIKQMPAFIMAASGDKKGAYGLMLAILKEEAGKVQQAELNNTIFFICHNILEPGDAAKNPLCTSLPPGLK